MERVEDVMNYEPDVYIDLADDSAGEKEYKKLDGCVDIQNLTFAYSPLAKPLIEDFNLHVKKGQMVALVGGSGSGKSTIAKVIAGLYEPRAGKILFDGEERKTGTFSEALLQWLIRKLRCSRIPSEIISQCGTIALMMQL